MKEHVLLKKYILSILAERDRQYGQRFDAQEKAVGAALAAAKEAVNKAESASEKRFDAVNEFRSTLRDQQATLMSRSEADAHFKAIDEKITQLQKLESSARGNDRGADRVRGFMVGAAGIAIAIAAIIAAFFRH